MAAEPEPTTDEREDPIDDAELEDEIPQTVLLALVTFAILMAGLYLFFGGHSHFH